MKVNDLIISDNGRLAEALILSKNKSFSSPFSAWKDGLQKENFPFAINLSPWLSGLYLLAKSVKEKITPYEFFDLGLKTGDFRDGVGTIINPVCLIESLK